MKTYSSDVTIQIIPLHTAFYNYYCQPTHIIRTAPTQFIKISTMNIHEVWDSHMTGLFLAGLGGGNTSTGAETVCAVHK